MKRITLILFFITIPVLLFPQSHPDSFILFKKGAISKSLSKGNPVGNGITDIIAIGNNVWIGTGSGVSISTDNGQTWTNKAFGNEAIAGIGYDKYHHAFWASTVHSEDVSGIGNVEVGSGLHYTTDNGVHWTNIPQPIDNNGDSIITYGINDSVKALPITVKVSNIIWDIDFTPNTIWIASYAGGIRRSTDVGQTWQRVVLPSDSLNSISPSDTIKFVLSPQTGNKGTGWLNYRAFSLAVANDSTVYVGTANGINKTTDAEAQYPSWTKFNHLNQDNSISGNFIVALGYNHTNNTIWGSTWKAEGYTEYYGVSYSTDEGENWKVVLPHEQVHNFGFKQEQTMAASDNGLFRSSDLGITWLTPGFIYDEKTKASITTNTFYSADASGDTIWVGSVQGLARLTETGTMWHGSWKVYNSAPETKEVYAFPNPFNPNLDEKITFKYDTRDKNENVTIRIFDFGMNYLRTVVQNAPRKLAPSDPPLDSWDGKDDNGNFVPNGVYLYRVDVGSNDPLFGKIIVLK